MLETVAAEHEKSCKELIAAAKAGDHASVLQLLSIPDVDVNYLQQPSDKRSTALHAAAAAGEGIFGSTPKSTQYPEIVAALLAAPGILVNAKNSQGYTPIMSAVVPLMVRKQTWKS